MNDAVTLYDFKSDQIHVNIVARFENGKLIIDGYDIGKTVEEAWGDSDYEYVLTVFPESVPKIFDILRVEADNYQALLIELRNRFHTNTCFSDLEKFLQSNDIPFERFTWT